MSAFAKHLQSSHSVILNAAKQDISILKLKKINNKIGAIQCLHYGLRNFHLLSLRLLTLHRAKHAFLVEPVYPAFQSKNNHVY
jgi:hypothetical protein